MTPNIRVLHVLWSGKSGGAERFVRDITVHSDKDKFLHGVCFLSEGGWLAQQMVEAGAKIYCLGMHSGLSILSALKIMAVVRSFRPDVIHNHLPNYLVSVLILLYPGIPKIYFEHGGYLDGKTPRREIRFYNVFGRAYRLILTNSDYMMDKICTLTTVPREKVKTLYLGVDVGKHSHCKNNSLKEKCGIPERNKVLGIVGRLVEQKGVDDFLRVAAVIKEMKNDLHCSFVVVGDGILRDKLKKMSQELNLDVKFLGDRQDVSELLRFVDVFVFTSKQEAFGIALIEAMASKVPIAGFSVPGAKEMFEKGGGGILIDERDHKRLARVVLELLLDEKRCNKLAQDGFSNVTNNFSIQATVRRLEDHYRKMMVFKTSGYARNVAH